MTASSANRCARSVSRIALIFTIALSPLAGARAQEAPSSPPVAPSPDATEVRPTGDSADAITIQPIPALSIDAIGVLSDTQGGLGLGMWRATSRSLVDAALPRLPVAVPSPTLRQLAERLLLSIAVPPAGASRISLTDLRATMLWQMGDLDALRRFAEAVPASAYTGALARLDVERRLLQGDEEHACNTAAVEVERDPTVFWQQTLAFCQARAGDQAKAALSLSLMREQNDEDPLLATLIAAMSGGSASIRSLPDPTPLQLAAVRAAKVALPDDVGSRAQMPILVALASLPETPVPARLRAADRAGLAGAVSPETVRSAYAATPASAADVNADSPEGRAALYGQIMAQATDDAKLEGIARALANARRQGSFALTTRVYEAELRGALPSPNLARFAGEFVPALLLLGERGRAAGWLRLASEQADSIAESAKAVVRALPTAAIAGLPLAESSDADALAAWSAALRTTPAGRESAMRVLALRAAVGEPVAETLFADLLGGPLTLSATTPQPVVGVLLNRAIAARQVGLSVLMTLLAQGERGPAGTDTVTLAVSLDGLRALGLGAEARQLALEAVAAMP